MDLRIPAGGVGQAIQQTGGQVSEIGNTLDIVQANFDYNDAAAIKHEADLRKQEHYINFWQKEDGSDPEAITRYVTELEKVDKEYIDRAYKINDRVGGYFEKYARVSTAQFVGQGQTQHFKKFYEKSMKVDMEETDRATKRAVTTGELFLEMDKNKVMLNARRPIYGNNVDGMITEANSYMVENFIYGRLANPVTAAEFLKRVQDDPSYKQELYKHLPATKVDAVEKAISAGAKQVNEITAMSAVIEKNTIDGRLNYNTAIAEVLSPEFATEYNLSINETQNIASSLKAQAEQRKQIAIEKVNAILVPKALERNGLNRQNDLTEAQWDELINDAPEYAAKLQDGIRRERDYELRAIKADIRADRAEQRDIERERKLRQQENESALLISDDFATRDLKQELAAGNITATQYRKLSQAQSQLNPINRDSVKSALRKVNSGTALKSALKLKNESEIAIWKNKYSDLVKAFAYNNAGDPDFDLKLSEFLEKKVLREMTESWFRSDEGDRQKKFQKAKEEAGELPNKGKKLIGHKDGKPVYDLGNGKWQIGD